MINPGKIFFTFPLYPSGTIQVAHQLSDGGMSVGTTRTIAKIQIPKELGSYPDDWFIISKDYSILKLKNEILSNKVMHEGTEKYFVPQSLLLQCYQYHWQQLNNLLQPK